MGIIWFAWRWPRGARCSWPDSTRYIHRRRIVRKRASLRRWTPPNQGSPGTDRVKSPVDGLAVLLKVTIFTSAGVSLLFTTFHYVSLRIGSAPIGSPRIASDRLGSTRIASDRLGSARIASDRRESRRLDSDRLGSARPRIGWAQGSEGPPARGAGQGSPGGVVSPSPEPRRRGRAELEEEGRGTEGDGRWEMGGR